MKPQGNSTWLRVVLTEGKNREIRRMLAQLGHKVMKLRRIAIGPVLLDRLPKGKARRLSEGELADLRGWVETAKGKIARARERAAERAAAPDASRPAAEPATRPDRPGRRPPTGPTGPAVRHRRRPPAPR
jgi:23S rRNA pseudouridine2605 synthase